MNKFKKIVKYIISPIVFILFINYLSLIFWGKDSLLIVAAKDFNESGTLLTKKIELVFWDDILGKDNFAGSLSNFNDTQKKEFMNYLYKNFPASSIKYKPQIMNIDSVDAVNNELNILFLYKVKYLFFYTTSISAYSPGFVMHKNEFLIWLFGWHRYSKPRFGIS